MRGKFFGWVGAHPEDSTQQGFPSEGLGGGGEDKGTGAAPSRLAVGWPVKVMQTLQMSSPLSGRSSSVAQ